MLERISNAAERLATNVSESRRGFLAQLGRTAIGAAAAVGGLLATTTQVQAAQPGFCMVTRFLQGHWYSGFCACGCTVQRNSGCAGPAGGAVGNGCGRIVGPRSCTCT